MRIACAWCGEVKGCRAYRWGRSEKVIYLCRDCEEHDSVWFLDEARREGGDTFTELALYLQEQVDLQERIAERLLARKLALAGG